MIHLSFPKLAGALFLVLLVLAVAGCGRRGPLDAPPAGAPDSQLSGPPQGVNPADYQAAVQTANPPPPSPDAAKGEIPNASQPRPVKPAPVTPAMGSFFLDPLIH